MFDFALKCRVKSRIGNPLSFLLFVLSSHNYLIDCKQVRVNLIHLFLSVFGSNSVSVLIHCHKIKDNESWGNKWKSLLQLNN